MVDPESGTGGAGIFSPSHNARSQESAHLVMKKMVAGLQDAGGDHTVGAPAAAAERQAGQNVARYVADRVAVIHVCCANTSLFSWTANFKPYFPDPLTPYVGHPATVAERQAGQDVASYVANHCHPCMLRKAVKYRD